jgi:hypothetical protein
MLDIIAALALGAMFAVDVTVLVGLAAVRPEVKVRAFAIAAAWAATVVAIAALGGFAPGAIGRLPAPVLAFSALVLVGLIAWFLSPAFRHALLSLPLAALVGINGFRIGGIFFLLLFADGRLSAPFAQSAGWGDIITGLLAIPLAAMAASGRAVFRRIVAAWNAFGALDLLVAIALAFLSAPGTPYRVFMDPPGTIVMTTLPWIAAATILVPLYLLTHFTIAARLRSAEMRNLPKQEPADAGRKRP